MCGITGIFNTNKSSVSLEVLRRMTDVIEHRGPDGEGFWSNEYVGFGHRRLSIIDISPSGHQPKTNEDGSMIISYNGEVYNFMNIRIELEGKGYTFTSRTDTEVVLKAYQEWGEKCVEKLNGMFAFSIWDVKKNELFLARDRYGIKPLYYYFKNNTLIWGSEIKSILQHPKVNVGVNLSALNEYFSFQNIFTDLTLFDNIKIFPRASWARIKMEDRKLEFNQFWDYNFTCEENFSDEKEYAEELDRLFRQAVNRQLVSDVEVGSYLSGGMDSGGITCIAASTFPNLKTFTAGFDLSSASGMELIFDERAKAEFLSSKYKTEHYEVVLKAGDMERVMPELTWHLEDLRVGQSYPNYYISRLASKFVKVVLSGTGGDEIFAGYPWRYYRTAVNYDFENYAEKYYRYWLRLIPDRFKPEFYQTGVFDQMKHHKTIDIFRSVLERPQIKKNILSPEEYINNSLFFEIQTFMHGLLVVEDKLSMANSLENRVPFLDNDLVDFGMKVPIKYKLKNLNEIVRLNENEPGPKTKKYFEKTNDGKMLLRKVLSNYVPTDYANGVKQGFSAPDASWFKGESIDYIRDLLFNNNAKLYNYLQPKKVQELLNEHFSGKTNHRLLVWSLLSFEWWLKTFMSPE